MDVDALMNPKVINALQMLVSQEQMSRYKQGRVGLCYRIWLHESIANKNSFASGIVHSAGALVHSAYLVVRSELHEVCHVNLVEGGQHGVGVLGALQALGHARPQPGHLHPPAQVSHSWHCDATPAHPSTCIAC